MAPVHFPTGRASRLRGCVVGIHDAWQGVSLSRESLPSPTQKERESSGMKRGGGDEGGGGGRRKNERDTAPIVEKGNWLR